MIKYPPDQWPDVGACKGWHNCGIFARAGSRDSVLESVSLCVSTLLFFIRFALFLPQSLLEPNSVKWVSKLKKKHPVVVLNLLVLGQRDPECYDFDGRGSAQPEFVGGVISGWLILVLLGWKNTGFQWGLAKISKFPNFCLNQHLKTSNLGEQGSLRDNLGWQWNEY